MSKKYRMKKVFAGENQTREMAQQCLESQSFRSAEDRTRYQQLYDAYRQLLRRSVCLHKQAHRSARECQMVSRAMEQVSQVDAQTNVYSRMYFMKSCRIEWKNAVRTGSPLSLIMVDIDSFKGYRNLYGHMRSEECLQKIARQLSGNVRRPRDVLARMGGDVFVILLPETGEDGGCAVAENMLCRVREMGLEHRASAHRGCVTVSIGLSVLAAGQDIQMEALIAQAEQALGAAKQGGRDCFRLYAPSAG